MTHSRYSISLFHFILCFCFCLASCLKFSLEGVKIFTFNSVTAKLNVSAWLTYLEYVFIQIHFNIMA